MSDVARDTAAAPRPFVVVTRLLRGMQRTRGRLAVVVGVGTALAMSALAVNIGGGGPRAIGRVVADPVLVIAVPLTALVFGVAALGDLRDDETLVYVWLRPVPRWEIAAAAAAASAHLAVPLNLLAVTGVVLLGGQAGLAGGAMLAVTLATLSYVPLFVAVGLRTSRSLLWGLGYVLLLEGFLSRFAGPLAALSVRRYSRSVFSQVTDTAAGPHEVSLVAAVAALVVIATVGLAATTRWLTSRDVP